MGHWYRQDTGEPCYEVPYADPQKGMRDATLRDAKKLNLSPSVTTILGVMDKPGLNRWKINEMMMAALTTPRKDNEPEKVFLARVIKDSQEASRIARDQGQIIHDAIEKAVNGEKPSSYEVTAVKARDAIFDKFECDTGWITEESFSAGGVGGRVDLYHPELNVVIDYKTKEKIEEGKKYHWPEQGMQLEAYAQGLGMKDARCFNLFVGWDGTLVWHEWSREDLDQAWRQFQACFNLWKVVNKYDPEKSVDNAK